MKKLNVKITVLYLLCLAILAVLFFVFREERLTVWPQNANLSAPRIYTDARESGFSTAEFFESDSALAMRTTLNSGLYHPHAGIEIPLGAGYEALTLNGMDFSEMDSVLIEFRASSDIALILEVADPVASQVGAPLSLRPLRLDIPATRYYSEHRLPLSALEPSKIWFDIHGVDPDSNLYLNHVVQVAVETGKGTLLGLPMEIEIQKLEFFGPNRSLTRLCLIILLGVTGLYIWGTIKVYERKKRK